MNKKSSVDEYIKKILCIFATLMRCSDIGYITFFKQ